MTRIRYARPRLTTPDDQRYREHVAQFMVQRNHQRAMHPPQQRDIFGGQAEKALRGWLATTYELSDRRILEYEQRQYQRATMKYRELDAVVFDDRHTISVFEIKASRAPQSIRRAVAQLQETRTILRLLYPTVRTTILFVNTDILGSDGSVTEGADSHLPAHPAGAFPDPRHSPPASLAMPSVGMAMPLMAHAQRSTKSSEVLADELPVHPALRQIFSLEDRHLDDSTIDLLILQVEDIIALAGAENLALDWSADDQQGDRRGDRPPSASMQGYSSHDEDDDGDSALAEALRRAGYHG